MRRILLGVGLAAIAAVAIPVVAQNLPTVAPGAKDRSRVTAGTYKTDASHSLIAWEVTHFGFNPYYGVMTDITGTLTLDPANPAAASVNVEIPLAKFTGGNAALDKHMMGSDFFDVEKFPTATFQSTKVTLDSDGDEAKIAGNLTIKGISKPVILDAELTGAGTNPFNKKETVGFEAETIVKRSDFGISYGIPMVTDEVKLKISVAFEKQ